MTNRFSDSFDSFACIGDTITAHVDGFDVTARIEYDRDMGPPWKEHDGHGPVSEWRRKDSKTPGERVLFEDRGFCRFYDFQEAVRIARRDGWDTQPFGQGTPGERAARAAEADFQAMRAWCNDEWDWCGVVLSVSKAGIELDDHAASLWGISRNYPGSDNSHLTEVANELLDEAVDAGRAAVELVTA